MIKGSEEKTDLRMQKLMRSIVRNRIVQKLYTGCSKAIISRHVIIVQHQKHVNQFSLVSLVVARVAPQQQSKLRQSKSVQLESS